MLLLGSDWSMWLDIGCTDAPITIKIRRCGWLQGGRQWDNGEPALTVGVAGYYLKQTTDLEVDGVKVTGQREEVFAAGPSMALLTKKDATQFLGASVYFESDGENRFEGWNFHFRYMIRWKSAEDLCIPRWRKLRKCKRSVPCDASCGCCN